jgi:hypothetical protein
MFKQGLFWHIVSESFNSRVSINLDFLTHALKITHLNSDYTDKDNLKSFIVYTGTSSIDFSELNKIMSSEVVSDLNKNGVDIYLYEPMSLHSVKHSPKYNRGFFSEFATGDSNADLRASELDTIQEFINRHQLTNVQINTCDYNVEILNDAYPTLNLCCRDIFLRTIGHRYLPVKKLERITKKFWCGNARYSVHRHAIMSYLISTPGVYSWHYQCNYPITDMPNSWVDSGGLSQLSNTKLTLGNNQLNLRYSWIDYQLADRQAVIDSAKCYFADPPMKVSSSRLYFHSFALSFVAVINETRFAQPTGNISEKTLHAIYARTPFILVAPPHSLEYMRSLGFKTFGKFWDESYDLEENHLKRLEMIFNVIETLNNLPIKRMRFMYKKMSGIIEHNLKISTELQKNTTVSRGSYETTH